MQTSAESEKNEEPGNVTVVVGAEVSVLGAVVTVVGATVVLVVSG